MSFATTGRLLPLLLASLLTAPAIAQKPKPPKDNPEVPTLLKTLSAVVKDRKGKRDEEGVRTLSTLTKLYPTLNKGQKADVVKGIGKVFRARRKPEQVKLLLAAGEGLSKLGKPGADILAKQVDNRKFGKKDWLDFRAQLVRMLGRPAELKYKKMLVKLAVNDKDDLIRGAAGAALGNYAKHNEKVRKDIAKDLIFELSGVYNQAYASVEPNDQTSKAFRDRLAAIQDPWNQTLTKLTKQRIRKPSDWVSWYNDNKHKHWDK